MGLVGFPNLNSREVPVRHRAEGTNSLSSLPSVAEAVCDGWAMVAGSIGGFRLWRGEWIMQAKRGQRSPGKRKQKSSSANSRQGPVGKVTDL